MEKEYFSYKSTRDVIHTKPLRSYINGPKLTCNGEIVTLVKCGIHPKATLRIGEKRIWDVITGEYTLHQYACLCTFMNYKRLGSFEKYHVRISACYLHRYAEQDIMPVSWYEGEEENG